MISTTGLHFSGSLLFQILRVAVMRVVAPRPFSFGSSADGCAAKLVARAQRFQCFLSRNIC